MAIEINGTTGISGVDGSPGTPALKGQDTNTGISFDADEVNVVTGGNVVTRFDSSGRVLIGQNDTTGVDAEADDLVVSSTAHTGITVRSGSSHNASVYFADQDAVRQGRIEYNHTSDYMRFNTGGTERLRITSDGTLQLTSSPGIDFSQIQTNATGMTSETLDSYEEGTWEPGYSFGGTAHTNVVSAGTYIKTGGMVFVTGYLYTNNSNTYSGTATITGLPFSIPSGMRYRGAFTVGQIRRFNEDMPNIKLYAGDNSSTISMFRQATNSNGATELTNTQFNFQSEYNILSFSGSYPVA